MDKQLPENLHKMKNELKFTNDRILDVRPTHIAFNDCYQTSEINYSEAFASIGRRNSFDLQDFFDNINIDILRSEPDELEFDITGIDAPLANAFRRIMISEVVY